MAFGITIPGIIRLVAVSTPEEVLAVNDASMIGRSLSGRGGLVNRSTAAKLAVFRTPEGNIWPAFRDRLDPLRAAHQAELEAALSDFGPLLRRVAPEIDELGAYVRTGTAQRSTGVTVQQVVGRLFFADYAADEESYAAARTLQSWLSAGPLRTFWLKHSGALQAALDQIMALSRGNMACAHATALAMDNIVRSVELMRDLAHGGDNLTRLGPQDALAQTLRAPARVVREARDAGRVGQIDLGPRSLVLLSVEKARRQRPDPGFAFFASAWNRCPAHSIVPAMLADIWQAAKTETGGRA
ncbi:hypothetical protein QIH87_47670 [Bradyrhizobium elkanii]|uniref:hypothetical protein n=1 Tax=Bradyrhizobium elkanii TaxID=29448 RepID=UPI0027147AC1|nr:hypothetical protein [Bradyrhizobium elkanii]WLB09525.1 hypothetical protein QIH87_47670 [Bradyrhizobium elkanii]WLB72527.1 hypothetical protein QIH89_00650 [Bradyrhizobium elkanii]